MRYGLSNYIMTIEPNDPAMKAMFGSISIGGEGSYTDSISIDYDQQLWSTEGYATGGWAHSKNLSRTGTASISLNQKAPQVERFIQMCNLYYAGDYDGLTISLTTINGEKVASCIDCYPRQIPGQAFQATAQNQQWQFTCGQITIN